jgi:predicted acylesterase/phospholipase RssA/CRP-like cAMP-binding protein
MTLADSPPGPEFDLFLALSGKETFFSDLNREELQALQSEARLAIAQGGETVVTQGEPAHTMYLVLSGRLRASRIGEDGNEQVVGEIGPGESVGEMALLAGGVRSATVRAIRDSQLLALDKDALERVIRANPSVALSLSRTLARRFERQQTSMKKTRQLATIAVISAGGRADSGEFSRRMAQALADFGTSFHVNRQVVETHLGESVWNVGDASEAARLSRFLDGLEARYRFVIYEGDTDSAWTDRCARQADRLLFLTDANADPKSICPSPSWQDALSVKDIVFIHYGAKRISLNIDPWYRALGAGSHHHVDATSTEDHRRLARILAGRATGLVLGGGGARGLAHVGVIRAIREAGIPIDMIGGTSMGSVIAAQYAMGCDEKTMLDLNRKVWIEMDPMKDKTLPLISLLAGKKLDRVLTLMFGDTRIEDLRIQYFCVSTNLTRAMVFVHRSGSLKTAVRASTAIPGVAIPVCHNGDLLVDGGVLNNLPGDEMRKICSGDIIAVDVSPQSEATTAGNLAELPSVPQILLSRLNPLKSPLQFPGILAIIARTATLSSVHQTNAVMKEVDLYIRPGLDGFGVFDWHSMDAIVEAGYRSAMTRLDDWRAGHPLHSGVKETSA